MSRGPLPSQLNLLTALAYREKGLKVRFLGCVTSYSASSATLKLGHDFPKDSGVIAAVDVKLLLEKLSHENLRVGEWLNVIGYITGRTRAKGVAVVGVQAVMVWSTGPMDVGRYEATFEGLR